MDTNASLIAAPAADMTVGQLAEYLTRTFGEASRVLAFSIDVHTGDAIAHAKAEEAAMDAEIGAAQ